MRIDKDVFVEFDVSHNTILKKNLPYAPQHTEKLIALVRRNPLFLNWEKYHLANPEAWYLFQWFALHEFKAGRKVSGRTIFDKMRYQMEELCGVPLKIPINNNHHFYYERLFNMVFYDECFNYFPVRNRRSYIKGEDEKVLFSEIMKVFDPTTKLSLENLTVRPDIEKLRKFIKRTTGQ